MRKIVIIAAISLFAVASYADQKAITDTGEEVILNSDGTWQYSNDHDKPAAKIPTNSEVFTKPKDSSFLLKSTRNSAAFWINTDKWSFRKAASNSETTEAAEYQFRLKGKDLYGMAINEGIEIALESLADLALGNARNVAPDAKIIKREFRTVNGKKLIYMEFAGTIQSIKFTYVGYFYSAPSGSTQLITYTASNLVDKYRPEITDFLNGLIIQ